MDTYQDNTYGDRIASIYDGLYASYDPTARGCLASSPRVGAPWSSHRDRADCVAFAAIWRGSGGGIDARRRWSSGCAASRRKADPGDDGRYCGMWRSRAASRWSILSSIPSLPC